MTAERDKPRLDVRHWAGNSPLRLVIDRRNPCFDGLDFNGNVPEQIAAWLYEQGKQSLIVEGGAETLQSFISSGLWDEIRIETASTTVAEGTKAPTLPDGVRLVSREVYGGNIIETFEKDNDR